MPGDDASILKTFFAIPETEIVRDIAAARDDPRGVICRVHEYDAIPEDKRTPLQAARDHHDTMIRAYAMGKLPNVPDDLALHHANYFANCIADKACQAAFDKGRLAELGREMEEIRTREGLTDDEYWPVGEGPPDYNAISSESDALFESIDETILLHIFRRYRFTHLAELYETDRMTFDVMNEVGRRLVHKDVEEDKDANEIMSGLLFKRHGAGALKLLKERLAAVGL